MSPTILCRLSHLRSLRLVTSFLVLLMWLPTGSVVAADWPQWGGPQRDFHVAGVDLGPWPEDGLKVLWDQPLGKGYSSIAAQDGRLYTLYREEQEEIVVCIEAATGKRLWSHHYEAIPPPKMRLNYGSGPHSTPLLVDGKVVTIGTTGLLWALDAKSGEALWSHDLWEEFGGTILLRGYAASPISYGNTILVTVGGETHGVMAFDQGDGSVRWHKHSFFNSQSSPILLEVEGQDHLVAFVKDEILAVDPADGELLWRHPHPSTAAYNISTPVWEPRDQILYLSSAYGAGSRALKLSKSEVGAQVEELWFTKRLRIHFTNAVRLGDTIYGSHGNTGAIYVVALDVETGELLWRDRAVKRTNFLVVGEHVLMMESEGRLVLGRLAPEGLTVLSEFQVFEEKSWTIPTLVDGRLYIRNEERIKALELPLKGPGAPQESAS